jgi:hypothetical protein
MMNTQYYTSKGTIAVQRVYSSVAGGERSNPGYAWVRIASLRLQMTGHIRRHCERSEAIHARMGDCFLRRR